MATRRARRLPRPSRLVPPASTATVDRRTTTAPAKRPLGATNPIEADVAVLVRDLGAMIEATRRQVSVAANAALVTLYWQIGRRVRTNVLEGRRAEYGAQVVPAVGKRLEAAYGRGFGEKNLRRMIQFAGVFPDTAIVAALQRQLGWTHFTMLLPIEDRLERDFYAEMCRVERWSTRDLRRQLDSMLFERTALSKKPEELVRKELAALRDEGEVSPALVST